MSRVFLIYGLKASQLGSGVLPDFLLEKRCPAEQQAGGAECLSRPTPEIKGVVVCENLTLGKGKTGHNMIFYPSTGLGKAVTRCPLAGSGLRIGTHAGVRKAKVLCPLTKHPPHLAGFVAV